MSDFEDTIELLNSVMPIVEPHKWVLREHGYFHIDIVAHEHVLSRPVTGQGHGFFIAHIVNVRGNYETGTGTMFVSGFEMIEWIVSHCPAFAQKLYRPMEAQC